MHAFRPDFTRTALPAHNEHLIPLARPLYWVQYRLEGPDGQFLFWGAGGAHFGVVLLTIREIQHRWPADRTRRRVARGGRMLVDDSIGARWVRQLDTNHAA